MKNNSSNNILNKVIDDTEKIFSRIAQNYPKLLGEFESGLKQASESIDALNYLGDDGAGTGEIRLNEKLAIKKRESVAELKVLEGYKRKNQEVLDRLSASIKAYKASQGYIEVIRDISESLQIVSLNALCNAVKAGKGGEGFSVITENLKNVTEDTIDKTALLEKLGDSVSSYLEEFFVVEKNIDSKRNDVISLIEQKVLSGIETFQSESETISSLFDDLNNESGRIKSSIQRIMQELQQQDLIRQTIDQVLLSLGELPDEYRNCAEIPEITEAMIDKAVFGIRITDLAKIMLDDIIAKLQNTVAVFTENFKTARTVLEYIQNEKDKAVDRFIRNLEELNRLSGMEKDIYSKTDELSGKRRELIDLILQIIRLVGEIAGEFASFDKISGWLQNVAVLARIELSRSAGLGGMRESVDDMSGLVTKIQQQITAGEKETGHFISGTSGVFEEYKEYAEEEMLFLKEFNEAFMKNIQEISRINNTFSSVLRNFDFFTEDFCSLFDLSEKDLDDLQEITEDLIRFKKEINCIEDKVRSQLENRLGSDSVREWDIRDDNMNRIIEKFTIYSHKKTAGEFSGLDIEDSELDAGEVTLF